jgi:hypothetical protein
MFVGFLALRALPIWSAEIGGVVRDKETSKGIPRVIVRATSLTTPSKNYEAVSDRNGSFVVQVPRGRYRVAAIPTGTNYLPGSYRNPKSPAEPGAVELIAEDVFTFANISLELGGSIAGRITRQADGIPLENVRVTAESDSFRAVTSTERNGNYLLRALPGNSYIIEAGILDSIYIPVFYPRSPFREEAMPISMGPGTKASGINIALPFGATIRGRVSSATTNQPIPDVMVIASPIKGGHPDRFSYTDRNGFFSIYGLSPGKYVVEAGDERVASDEGTKQHQYGTQFFEREFDRDLANAVEVDIGGSVTGVDFSLFRGNSIRGVVRSSSTGQLLADVTVVPVLSSESKLRLPVARTDEQGNYEVGNLPPGSYFVTVNLPEPDRQHVPTWYRDQIVQKKATALNLRDGDTYPNVDFNLRLGGNISGHVEVDDPGYSMNYERLHLVLSAAATDIDGFEPRVYELDSDGHYSITGAPIGRFHFTVTSDDPNIMPGQENDKALVVTEGVDMQDVDFNLRLGGSIAGKVTLKRSHLPLDKYRILVLRINEPFYEILKIEGDHYTSAGLKSGKYAVILVEEQQPMTLEKLFSGPRWYDSRIVDVTRGVTAADVDFIIDESHPITIP